MNPIHKIIIGFIVISGAAIIGFHGNKIEGKRFKKTIFRWATLSFGAIIGFYGIYIVTKGFEEREEQVKMEKVKELKGVKNTFQDIVKILESQLAQDDTRITPSVVIKDIETGEYREIPLLLERKVGVHTIKIAIEFWDKDQPAPIEFIDLVIGKYRALGIPNIVLVSKFGFDPAVHKKAKSVNIQLLAFEEVLNVDRTKIINKLDNVVIGSFLIPYLTKVTVLMPPGSTLPEEKIDYGDCSLVDPNGRTVSTLKEWAEKKIQDKNVIEGLSAKISENGNYTLSTTIPLLDDCTILTPSNNKIPVRAIKIKAKCRKESKVVSLAKASYGEAQVAFGSEISMGHELIFVFSEIEQAPAKAGVLIKKIDDKQ